MTRLEREVRFLRWYVIASSAVFVILGVGAFRQQKVLDVERLNIRNPDGSLSLAIAGKGNLPGPMMDGQSFPQEISQGRTSTAGMIFFNESGDEVGGMTWGGQKTASGYQAGEHLSFDHWKQDEVVTISYQDDGTNKRAGIQVTDRPRDYPLTQAIPLIQRFRSATGPARDSLEKEVQALGAAGKFGASRIFLGAENETASLRLKDKVGKDRIRLMVDPSGGAKLEFLDATGKVVAKLP